MLIADLHCDTILDIVEKEDYHLRDNNSHIDCLKLKKGEYILQNFAMFTNLSKVNSPFTHVNNMIDKFYEELNYNKDILSLATSFNDIENNMKDGKISAILTIEEGAVCEGKINYLHHLRSRGVRMMTLTWNYSNCLAAPNSNEDKNPVINNEKGLTDLGFEIVYEMEKIGIIPDVSHLSDKGFYDIAKICRKPFVASHSNAREICNHPRNLTDDMIKTISDRNGVIGLNYCNSFLSNSCEKKRGVDIECFIPHINHILKIGGEDCLGLGTDFDGIDSPPLQIPDASKQQNLVTLLEKNGFKETVIEKICYKNIFRLYKELLV